MSDFPLPVPPDLRPLAEALTQNVANDLHSELQRTLSACHEEAARIYRDAIATVVGTGVNFEIASAFLTLDKSIGDKAFAYGMRARLEALTRELSNKVK